MSQLKRIHLFEFEDQSWFPDWLRRCITRLITVMHNLLETHDDIARLVREALTCSEKLAIIDLCSGSGGPMLKVHEMLTDTYQPETLSLTLTDLYPDTELTERLNKQSDSSITYLTRPVDATDVDASLKGVRTMVGSLHHLRPVAARATLKGAMENRQPICVYELSDNSTPIALWWIGLPVIFLMTFFITPLVRPMTWKQIVFTYVFPIVPLCFAWDGAVSNARTYTLSDLDKVLEGLESEEYSWKKGRVTEEANKLYLLGFPNLNTAGVDSGAP